MNKTVDNTTLEGTILEGTVDMSSSGNAYIKSPEFDEDIMVGKHRTMHALHGDRVQIRMSRTRHRTAEWHVVKIVDKGKRTYTGMIQVYRKFAFLVADSPKMPVDIYVPLEEINGANDGNKVVVDITGWGMNDKNPKGKVTKILGTPGEHSAEMGSIISDFNLPTFFPREVIEEALEIQSKGLTNEDFAGRRDFRDVLTVTIDPVDAKDFDDAISIKKLSDEVYEIGVHIADVSHYVRPGTALDNEAYNRATSVYLVDRVIPMLPVELSNDVCSLNPGQDKLCMSIVFEYNTAQNRMDRKFIGKTVINSDKRYTYEQVQEIIEGSNDQFSTEIHKLNHIAAILRNERMRDGSISFEKEEVKFKLDEDGNPLSVQLMESNESHWLIEEFMLLANKKIAERITDEMTERSIYIPFVYRIHDEPDVDKLQKFSEFLQKNGITKNFSENDNMPKAFNSLIGEVRDKSYENIVNILAVRTMSKAIYNIKNIGHYGLGFDDYTHFTSPIRRYPDLMVHRLMYNFLNNIKQDTSKLKEECEHCSRQEKMAAEAERMSIKYKQAQYLSSRGDEVFDGSISGITANGFFVELKTNKCEGFVRTADMEDNYVFDMDNYRLKNTRTGDYYQLGQSVRVKVKKTDVIRKQIDFETAE